MIRLPLVKIIYTALQDLFSAFVSDKKKFDKPVMVIVNKTSGLKKFGFITQEDLSQFGLKDEVAVYLPHSYNFSGNLFVAPRENVILLDNISSSDTMKFIVSGGVTKIDTGSFKNPNQQQHKTTRPEHIPKNVKEIRKTMVIIITTTMDSYP